MTNLYAPLGVKDQLGYVFGDMAGSFVNLFVDAYFLTFCTYVLGISPEWMAGLFLAARLWDAINDPITVSYTHLAVYRGLFIRPSIFMENTPASIISGIRSKVHKSFKLRT